MSHYTLTFSNAGTIELTRDGRTVWASDADPDFVDEFGDDVVPGDDEADDDDDDDEEADDDADDDLIDDVLDYLVAGSYLSVSDADRCKVVLPPWEPE